MASLGRQRNFAPGREVPCHGVRQPGALGSRASDIVPTRTALGADGSSESLGAISTVFRRNCRQLPRTYRVSRATSGSDALELPSARSRTDVRTWVSWMNSEAASGGPLERIPPCRAVAFRCDLPLPIRCCHRPKGCRRPTLTEDSSARLRLSRTSCHQRFRPSGTTISYDRTPSRALGPPDDSRRARTFSSAGRLVSPAIARVWPEDPA